MDAIEDAVENGLSVLLHNYFPAPASNGFVLNIADPNSEARERSILFAERAMELSARFGAPLYSVHAGFGSRLLPEHLGAPDRYRELGCLDNADRLAALAAMHGSVRRLLVKAESLGLVLLLENNVVHARILERGGWHGLLLADADEIVEFLEPYPASQLGLLLDTAHASVSCRSLGSSLEGMLRAVSHRVGALHVSHTDGIDDRNLPLRSDTPGLDMLGVASDVATVIEAYGLEPRLWRDQVGIVEATRAKTTCTVRELA